MVLSTSGDRGIHVLARQPNPSFQARTFLLELRRETTIRDDQVPIPADQQHRRIAGEPGQVADVRGRAHQAAHRSPRPSSPIELLAARMESIHTVAFIITKSAAAAAPVAAAAAPVTTAATPVATTADIPAAAAVIPRGAAAGIVVGADDGVAALVGDPVESGT